LDWLRRGGASFYHFDSIVSCACPARWLDWHRAIAPNNREEIRALETDQGQYLGYVRLIGRKRADAPVRDVIVSAPVEYKKTPLLNGPT